MRIKVNENKKLAELTTFKIGGSAKYYCEVKSEDEVEEVVKFAKSRNLKIFVIGEGSDVLVSDNGFNGLVIKYLANNIELVDKGKEVVVTANAGLAWDDLVEKCVNKKLQGIECMSGIPGTVGAAPIQNIGAYGQELKDVFLNLKAYDIVKEQWKIFDKEKCQFGYRDSVFKKSDHWQKYIITEVSICLYKTQKPEVKYDSLKNYLEEKSISDPKLSDIRRAVLDIRSTKFENYKKFPNAGSFFKNPVINSQEFKKLSDAYGEVPCFENDDGTYKCFAGWFIEQAGWKGKKLGNAQVSSKHALILLNPDGKAKASEIKSLASQIQNDVMKKFGIELETEVQYV